MGRGVIAERCLKTLLGTTNKYQVAAICSNKDPEQFWWKSNEIYRTAKRLRIPFIDSWEKNNEKLLETMVDNNIGMIVSVQHSWIIPEYLLDLAPNRAYNLHNAKLPNYKGFYTISHEILNREKEHCCTIHRMAPVVDTGHVLMEGRQPIYPYEDARTVFWKSVDTATSLFSNFISRLSSGLRIHEKAIQHGKGCFYSKKDFESLTIDLITNENISPALNKRLKRALSF